MNDKIGIYDHSTGINTVRELTDEEQAERNAEIKADQIRQLAKEAEAQAKADAKAAAQAKLAALGLTVEDLQALGL